MSLTGTEIHFNKGKIHSDDARKRMSEAHKGYIMPDEQKNKISMAHLLKRDKLTKQMTDEGRAKKSKYQKERYRLHGEELKEKRRIYLQNIKANPDTLKAFRLKEKKYALERKEKRKIYLQTPKAKFSIYKKGAEIRGYSFELSFEIFENMLTKNCSYCGGFGGGIDRVDNSQGYKVENCVPCCGICNMMKLGYQKESFLKHIESIYLHNYK